MYLHKYESDGSIFYLVGSAAKPAGSINLTVKEWKGRATGQNVDTAVKMIHKAFKDGKEEAEMQDAQAEKAEPEKKSEPKDKVEKAARWIPIAEHIRYLGRPKGS